MWIAEPHVSIIWQ